MKQYILFNPSSGVNEILDQLEMWPSELYQRNKALRESGSDNRWIIDTEDCHVIEGNNHYW